METVAYAALLHQLDRHTPPTSIAELRAHGYLSASLNTDDIELRADGMVVSRVYGPWPACLMTSDRASTSPSSIPNP